MTDVTEYTNLLTKAADQYLALKETRLAIKAMEQHMLQEMQNTQSPIITVVTDNQRAIIKLQDRSRRIPLTEADLKRMLATFLHAQFTNIPLMKMEEFAISIADRIWKGRRIKQDRRVVLKMVNTI
jgi:hypothetical protein